LAHPNAEVLALNIAGRNANGKAAYYVVLYRYYLSRTVTARGVFYGQVDYA
jgi:hypothetical protein